MKLRILTAAVLAATCAAPGLAAGVTPVGPALSFGTADAPAQFPTVAMRADGSFVVAWTTGTAVMAQRYAAGGTPQGAAIAIYTAPSPNVVWDQPKLTMNAAGDFALAWHIEDSGNAAVGQVEARVYGADGTPLGAAFRFDDDAHPAVHFGFETSEALALDAADHVLGAWTAAVPGKTGLLNADRVALGLYVRRFTAAGAALDGAAQEISNGGKLLTELDSVSAAVADDGHYLVSWSAGGEECTLVPPGAVGCLIDLQPSVVHFRQLDSSGKPKGAVATVLSSLQPGQGLGQQKPLSAMNGSGTFALMWLALTPVAPKIIHSQEYSAAGVVKGGGAVDFPRTQCCSGFGPVVAIDPAGDYVVAYEDQLRLYAPDSSGRMQAVGPAFNSPTSVTGLAMGSGNQFVLVGSTSAGYGQIYSFSK